MVVKTSWLLWWPPWSSAVHPGFHGVAICEVQGSASDFHSTSLLVTYYIGTEQKYCLTFISEYWVKFILITHGGDFIIVYKWKYNQKFANKKGRHSSLESFKEQINHLLHGLLIKLWGN